MQLGQWRRLSVAILLSASSALAANLRSPGIAPQALQARLAAAGAPLVVDVRSPTEYSAGHVPGAVNMPAPTVTRHLDELRQADELVLYCNSYHDASSLHFHLTRMGYTNLRAFDEGMKWWEKAGLPRTKGTQP